MRTLAIASSCSPGSTWDAALNNQHPQIDKHIMRLHPILPFHHRVHVCKKKKLKIKKIMQKPRNVQKIKMSKYVNKLFLEF
jgi:hypothetical protein